MGLNRLYTSSALLSMGLNILLSAPVMAQISSPALNDEIIVTGLRHVPLSDVTASVSILDAPALEIRNSPFLVDQLRAVPGLGVSRSGASGSLTQVRLRGAEANHTLVLLNGIEISDPANGETDFGLWSGLNVTRIEVARGEQSALYGSDAIGGVISLSTGGDGFNIAGEYGSFDTFRGQAGYEGKVLDASGKGLSYGVAGSVFSTNGVDSSGTEGGARDGSDSQSFIFNAQLELPANTVLSALTTFRASNTDFDSDTDFDGLLNDIDNSTDSRQWISALSLDTQTGPIDHILRANYARVNRENFTGDNFNNETIGQRSKFSYSPSLTVGTDTQGLTVSALAEYENETFERIDTNTAFGDPNQNVDFDTFGIGGEVRARFNGLVFNGSARFDDNDGQFENATTWRFGAAYNFPFGGRLRGSIGEGVKNPTFTELFGFFPASFVGNPDLIPERSQSFEFGYDQSFGNFNASFTFFSADLENEIFTSFTPAFLSSPANRTEQSEREGFEASANWQINDALYISGFVSKIDSTDDNGADEIRVPEWTGSASVNWQPKQLNGLRLGVAADFVGSQDDFNFGSFPAARVNLDSYVLLSATAEYPVTDHFSLTVRGENLIDETVTDVFGSTQTGAGVFVGFKIR